MKILLGPAGSPARSSIEGLSAVRELGLQAMEVEFTHGMNMSNALAKQIGEENKIQKISLSVHAPYYINLASEEKAKITASKKRILDSCERAHYMGASQVVFHAAFYGKRDKEEIYQIVKKETLDMQKTIKKNKWNVKLAPETTGKQSQFGTLDELLRLKKDTNCSFCIDFAHIFARNNGKINYKEIFIKTKSLKYLHCHFSGINYTAKGERNHVNLNGKPSFKDLAKEILKRKLNITIICESPITWRDSLKMKKIFEKLGYKF